MGERWFGHPDAQHGPHATGPEPVADEHHFDPEHLLMHEAQLRARLDPADVLRELFGGDERLVVDVGAGVGTWSMAAAALLPGASVLAVDRQADMVAVLEGRFRAASFTNATAVQADAEALPVADGAADAVLMTMVLHDLRNADAALVEAFRALGPDGRLVIIEFHPDAPDDGPPRERLVRPERLAEMVAAAGFGSSRWVLGPGPFYRLVARPVAPADRA